MNKNILYILLFSYTSMLCKPILPYVVDTLEHILLYDQHIATVHVENGKMHVHKEAVDAGADLKDDQPSTSVKKSYSSWDHLPPVFTNCYIPTFIEIALNQYLPISSYPIFSFSDYPPPRLFFI
jgi:hypothetical protein